ncbi:alkaline shock response membrane anchor protein AmaP [Alcanivorax marinus]|uniref:Alkaline shock response membrane anchor protein AmaP n=1 Tax=Alloalcanivorax marinus TaxID=1177169 RepID=A0A9Q3YP11_9GAMM|nr:alkaline shock response membrane anchor protein AmaP [Alloalcanivorax marinus]MCC4310409.1 alkaline shock response membrane anchor protein AmaP [Alloalcanivorax marinus]
MTVLKIINEGGQWAAIVVLLALLFFIGVDFFSSAPKRVTGLESKQEQQERLIQSMEERLSQVEADLEGLRRTQSAVGLQEQINSLRSNMKNITSAGTTPTVNKSEAMPVQAIESNSAEGIGAHPWYQMRYFWVGAASVIVSLILLLIRIARRRKKTAMSVVPGPGYKSDRSISKYRDCA